MVAKKGRKTKTNKRADQRTNLLVYKETKESLDELHVKTGNRYLYETIKQAIDALWEKYKPTGNSI